MKNNMRNLFEGRGAYNAVRFMARDMAKNIFVDEIIYREGDIYSKLTEDHEALPPNIRGGIVTFSTVMNSTILSKNILINKFKQAIESIKNKIFANRKIDKIADKFNLQGWTVTKGLHGRYKDRKTGQFFDESSISVELVGIDEKTLLEFAEELCKEFNQQSVLVKSYETGDVWFVEQPSEESEKSPLIEKWASMVNN